MKQRFLYIMALLLTAATGAWAQDDSDLIDLTPGADGTEWTLAEMPAFDLELEVTYYTDEEIRQMDITLADADTYTQTADETVGSATYVKTTDRVDKFHAWFIPFDYTITDGDLQTFSFYKINMIANAPDAETKASDDIWVFLKKMDEGDVLHANMPYVYKPKQAVENYGFTTTGATLKAMNTGVLATMQTMEDTYTLYGTYEGTTATAEDPFYYVNIDGDLSLGNNGTVTVGAYRWIMRVESKSGAMPAYARGIHFVGGEDSETTGISEERRVKSEALDLWSLATEGTQEFATAEGWYSLDGRRIAQPTRSGVYIVGGKKVVIR